VSRSVSVGIGSVEVIDCVQDEFVVAHGGAARDEFVGLLVAENGSNLIERSRSVGLKAREVADELSVRALAESAEEGSGDVGPPRSGEGAESKVQRRADLWPGALVAPDEDGLVEEFQRSGVVSEAGPKIASERHEAAGSKGGNVELAVEVEVLLSGGKSGCGVVAPERPGGGVVGVGEDVRVA
jgi:hypothetical protein